MTVSIITRPQPFINFPELSDEDLPFSGMTHRVAIVWFKDLFDTGHVSLAVDGILKGHRCGLPATEPRSLSHAIYKSEMGGGRKFNYLRVMPITVSDEGYQILKEWQQQKFYPCLTCMHAVARILAAATPIRIPFFISQSPGLSEVYLRMLHHRGAEELGYTFEFRRGRASTINPDLRPGAVCAGIDGLVILFMMACGITGLGLSLLDHATTYYSEDASLPSERFLSTTWPIVLGAIVLRVAKQFWDARQYVGQFQEDSPLVLKGIANSTGKAIIIPQNFQDTPLGAYDMQQEVEWGMRHLIGPYTTHQQLKEFETDLTHIRTGYLNEHRRAKVTLSQCLQADQTKVVGIFGRFSRLVTPFYTSSETSAVQRHITALENGLKSVNHALAKLSQRK